MVTDVPIISADSHITEPPDTYTARIDARFRDRAPRLVHDAKRGDLFVIDGLDKPIPMGLIAAAGKPAEELTMFGARFEDLHRGGWDPEARLADQARDGVSAEVIYPTVGMMICNHPDFDYKQACFDAYNLWIAEYCAAHPDRLLGIGQTAMRSVDDGIRDLRRIRELGLRRVMLPGNPAVADYHDPVYAPFYEAAIDLGLPLSFHILTSQQDTFKVRGPKLNAFMSIIRGCVWSASRPTPDGCRTSCTAWTTPTTGTATGCRRERSRRCRASTSASTSTPPSRTTGSPSR